MDEDSCGRSWNKCLRTALMATLWIVAALLLVAVLDDKGMAETGDASLVPAAREGSVPPSMGWMHILPATLVCLALSAFLSSSEVAFFSLHRFSLLTMGESRHILDRLVARLMAHPGDLLTTILMANCAVNVLLGVFFAAYVEETFALHMHPALAYSAAVAVSTAILVFFGEVLPKLLVGRHGASFAKVSAVPIFLVSGVLMPFRVTMMHLVGFLFRVTGFSRLRPAPFMTDEEFKRLLSEGEATGAIERDERQMIQGIIEFSDVMLREILVPRPDMVALDEKATVDEALAVFREHEFARMPVYREDLDHIVGVLYAKDLLIALEEQGADAMVLPIARKAHFVPETMSVADFLRVAQRSRAHLAIVVDEFGGTEGLVTLQDALREVVGDIGEENGTDEDPPCREITPGVYSVEGSFPLDELQELTGVEVDAGEHTTVAGFLMEQTDKIPEAGDRIEHEGVRYTVETMDGKRVERLRIEVPRALREKEET